MKPLICALAALAVGARAPDAARSAGGTSSGEDRGADAPAQQAASEFCMFTNNDGVQCRELDSGAYNYTWCTGRARGRVGNSCTQAWAVHSVQQVFEETEPA